MKRQPTRTPRSCTTRRNHCDVCHANGHAGSKKNSMSYGPSGNAASVVAVVSSAFPVVVVLTLEGFPTSSTVTHPREPSTMQCAVEAMFVPDGDGFVVA